MEALGEALSGAAPAGLKIRPASRPELPAVSAILVEAARWLIDRGMPLWQPDELGAEALEPYLTDRALQLATLDGEPAGTLLYLRDDPLMWRDVETGDSAFVHRLAVRRCFAGSGLAPALLAWADARARSEGCHWLRLDCSRDHPGLCAYYQAAGFSIHSEGPHRTIRFQRAIE